MPVFPTSSASGFKRTAVPAGMLLILALASCSKSSSKTAASSPSDSAAGAYTVNTANCEDKAAVTKKISGSIKIGYSAPLSGPVAGVVGYDIDGFKGRLNAENAKGGINGLKIEVSYKDDAYTPDKAKANGTQFLQSDHVDILNTFGSGPVGAIADDQNAACVPLLYPSSSVQQYRDISKYPWTVQYLPAGDAEARYDVNLIKSKFPGGAKVGIAENQTASGKGYSAAFQNAAKGSNLTIATITPSTDPNAAATALQAAGVDVVYDAGITTDCGPVVQALARVGFKPKLVVNPSNCADQTAYIAAGQAADGNVIPAYLKDPGAPDSANDPGVKAYLADVNGAKAPTNTITISGWVQADLTINTLKQAAASKNGLTHASIIEAARNQTYASPMMVNGVKWVSTPTELVGMNAFQTRVWNAASKLFVAQGDLISVASK